MKKNTLLLVLMALVMMPFGLQAQNVKYEEYDLENGLHVILAPNHKTPNVVVSVMYHVGSKNEEAHLTGFAHFFEHLMFEGTENIPRHTYDQYVSKAGGSLNANTSMDRTYYFELLPSNYLELGLWLESERMLHPKIEEIGVNTQKNVVCQEMEQTRDNQPYGDVLYQVLTHAYKVHGYNHDVIGSEEHVRGASTEDFKNFHDMFYVPNNAVLVICGDFQPAEGRELVEKYFAEIPRGTQEIRRPDPNIEPRRTEPVKDTIYDDIEMPMLIQVYNAPAYGTRDAYALDIFTELLCGGETSPMYKTVVNEKRTGLMAAGMSMGLEHPGVYLFQGIPNNVDVSVLEADIDAVLYSVLENGVSDEEFQKVMNSVEFSTAYSNSRIEGIAEQLATNYTYLKDTENVNRSLENYTQFTKEEVLEIAKKYFVPAEKISLYYLPKEK